MRDLDRRTFLVRLGGLGLAGFATACASDDQTDKTGPYSKSSVLAAEPANSELADGIFSLGVASGDPTSEAIILWTRLASDPLSADGGAPKGAVEIAYDVASDEDFNDLVISDTVKTDESVGHSVHVDATGLEPDTWYYYRFRAGGQTSDTGRTRTFPASGGDSFRFVFASCQDFQWGYYGAWKRAMEQPDLDAVIFLGDYIYELNLGDASPDKTGDRVWAGPEPETVEHYRRRYAQTKGDKDLQAAHAALPWIFTFDDHEVSNNYSGDVGQEDDGVPLSASRRIAGYQAWYENTPIRLRRSVVVGSEQFVNMPLHRNLDFGDLARIHIIETRQYADVPPCRESGSLLADDGPGCDEMNQDDRTILGDEQEEWLIDSLSESTSSWNVLGNPVMLAGLNIGSKDEPEYTRDMWDGYPAARSRILDAIDKSGVSNPVAITGDWHASFVLDVKPAADEPTLMPEFVGTAISTVIFGEDYTDANPHVRYFVGEHGYCLVDVSPDEMIVEFHYIEDVWDPDSQENRTDRWKVSAGNPVPVPMEG